MKKMLLALLVTVVMAGAAQAAVTKTFDENSWGMLASPDKVADFEIRANAASPAGDWELGIKSPNTLRAQGDYGFADEATVGFNVSGTANGLLSFTLGGQTLNYDLGSTTPLETVSFGVVTNGLYDAAMRVTNLSLDGVGQGVMGTASTAFETGTTKYFNNFISDSVFTAFSFDGEITFDWDSVLPSKSFLTGYVAVGAPAPTPIPGAVWLLGSGLVGLVGVRRKMKA